MDFASLLSSQIPAYFVLGPLVVIVVTLVVLAARKASPVITASSAVASGVPIIPSTQAPIIDQAFPSPIVATALSPVSSVEESISTQTATALPISVTTPTPAAVPLPVPVPQPVTVPQPEIVPVPEPVSVEVTLPIVASSGVVTLSSDEMSSVASVVAPVVLPTTPLQPSIVQVSGSVSTSIPSSQNESVVEISNAQVESTPVVPAVPPVSSWKPIEQVTTPGDQINPEVKTQAEAEVKA